MRPTNPLIGAPAPKNLESSKSSKISSASPRRPNDSYSLSNKLLTFAKRVKFLWNVYVALTLVTKYPLTGFNRLASSPRII